MSHSILGAEHAGHKNQARDLQEDEELGHPARDTPNDAIERILDAAEEHRTCMTEAST